MEASLELARGSRWSEREWELREAGEVRGRLVRASWWRGTWRAEAGPVSWDIQRAGWWRRALVARGGDGAEAARYRARGEGDALVLADGRRLSLHRRSALRSERVLLDGERELARLRPRGLKRGVDLELGPGGAREPGLVLPLLIASAVLLVERDDASAAAAGGAVAAGAAG